MVIFKDTKIFPGKGLVERRVLVIIPYIEEIHNCLNFFICLFLHLIDRVIEVQFSVQYYSLFFIFHRATFFSQAPQSTQKQFHRSPTLENVQNRASSNLQPVCIMSNGSMNQPKKSTPKNVIIDYRNAKYQGETSQYQRLPNGIGILLSVDYMLVIGNWADGKVDGESVIFYPSGSIIYGSIGNNQPSGLCVCQISRVRTMYGFLRSEGESFMVTDCQLKQTLTLAKLASGQVKKMLGDDKNKHQQMMWMLDSNNRLNKKLQMLNVSTYKSQQQKWQILQQLSGQTIKNEYKSYKAFIKCYFNTKITPKDKRLELIQTKDYTQIRYKKAGIVCRIEEKIHMPNRVKLLGFYDNHEQQCDIFIKNKGGIQSQIQEYCQGHSITYGKQRPKQCYQNLLTYFKKSINFVNRYIPLEYFHDLKTFYQRIDNGIEGQMSIKNAQIQLQMGQRFNILDENDNNPQIPHQSSNQHLQLRDIKNDIYNKVGKIKTSNVEHDRLSMRKSASKARYPQENSQYQYNYKNNEVGQSPARSNYQPYQDQIQSKHIKSYLKYAEQSPTIRSRFQLSDSHDEPSFQEKRFFYIPREGRFEGLERQNINMKRDQSLLRLNLQKVNRNEPSDKKQQRYNYQPFQDEGKKNHQESVSMLTQNYLKIKEQLKRGQSSRSKKKPRDRSPNMRRTSASKSPSRYNYLGSSAFSPHGTPTRGKRNWR